MLATATDVLPVGRGLGVRAEVGRVQGARARRRRRRHVPEPQRQRPHDRASPPRRAPSASRCARPRRCSTARSARSTRRAAPGFGLLQQGAGSLVFVAFDVLEVDGEPLVDRAVHASGARRSSSSSTPRSRASCVSPSFDDGAALEQRRARARARRASSPSCVDSPYRPGRRTTDWRKLKLKSRQELVVAGFTRGQGRRSSGIGALVLGVHAADGPALRGQRRHRLHRPRARPAREDAAAAPARDDAVRRGAEDAEGAARRRDLGRADARGRDRVRRVDARRQAAGARLPRPARG